MVVASSSMESYFKKLEEKISEIYEIAKKARSLGLDPELEPEIPRAEDLAARVEKLVGPPGVAEVIRGLEKELPREELALKIAEMIVDGKFGEFGDQAAAEQAIRTSLAIITEAIAAAAPLEGITHVEIRRNFDESPYLALYFAGPIRSAGGTAAALAVLTGDFVRRKLYLGPYKPIDEEIERFVEEVDLYANEVAHLQYTPPSSDDIRIAVRNIPVEITGEPTERDVTVTVYRNLKRTRHNLVRGGAVLALVEGVLQKAPKILKHVKRLNIDGWDWLSELMARAPTAEEAGPAYPKEKKYLEEIIAGRPVFAHPDRGGGFRLRYGRARNTGIAAAGVHPATMAVLNDFIAVGTQLKIERPGKGAAVAPVDSIDGPTVKLADGSVVQITSPEQAIELRDKISEILFLGDILLGFGEFLENNHPLMPAGYCEEWWGQEVEKALGEKQFDIDLSPYVRPPQQRPSPKLAIEISEKLGVPLHPAYIYHFHDIDIEELKELAGWLLKGEPEFEGEDLRRLKVKIEPKPKRVLEVLGVPHRVENSHAVIGEPALPLCKCLGLLEGKKLTDEKLNLILSSHPTKEVMDVVQALAGFPVRRRAPTRIGCRMGRPEKANPRLMQPPVHLLFPVGLKGGATRSVLKAAESGEVFVEVARLECPECGTTSFRRKCPKCGATTSYTRICTRCGRPSHEERCLACNAPTAYFDQRRVDIKSIFEEALKRVGETPPDEVKGVRGMTSAYKIPEPLEKGILRAKHGVYVFKDGTVRFDATDLPLTHFRPREIGVPVERLRELGYTVDYAGQPLERDDQIVELKVQDLLLSKACAEYLLRASKFVDELLQKFYGLPPYYNATWPADLIGHLVIGLAPHTSAGIVGRIIGFTDANVGYAHPYFHAAKRRNCFDPDTTIVLYDKEKDELFTSKIGDFVEKLIVEKTATAEEINIKDARYKAVSLNFDTGGLTLANVSEFQRRKAPKEMLEITTEGDKKIRVTPDHKVLVYRDDQLLRLEAKDIREGDAIPSAIRLPKLVGQMSTLNLAKELVERGAINPQKLILRDVPSLASNFLSLGSKLQFLVERTGYDYSYIWRTLHSGKVHMSLFLAALKEGLINWGIIPKGAKLGIIRDDVVVPAIIPLTNEFARILGYYLSEGHAHANKTTWQLVFDPWDKEILDDLRRCIKKVFGLPAVPDKNKEGRITLCSRLIYHLFVDILKIGKTAREKRVPWIAFKMPKLQLAHFLNAYFCGDGYKAPTGEIRFTSASKTLLEGISLVLLKLGIRSRFVYPKPRYPGGKVQRRYKELGLEVPKLTANVLIVQRRSNKDFIGKIGLKVPVFTDGGSEETVNQSIVKKVQRVKMIKKFVYCLTVSEKSLHNLLLANGIIIGQCDGDEDAVMLLLDALLNFSKRFLPASRGGSMDSPLVLTTRLNPAEIDEEAHNMDVMSAYPLEFYEATMRCANPGELLATMETVKRRLGKEAQYEGLRFSRDTSDISVGPHFSRYKTLETMIEKTDAQLSLARKIRAVDERDVAERLVEHHFIPDLKGNLRAFSSQQFRCIACNAKYRRVPLNGVCSRCGGKLVLTVTRGGVEKYLQVAMRVAQEYGASDYTKQRLKLVQRDIRSLFESDAHRQLSLADFI